MSLISLRIAAIALTLAGTPAFAADLEKLGFGVGIAATFLPDDEINDTDVANGFARITDSDSTKRDVWLETHYLMDGLTPENWNYWSWGPFVGLRVGGDSDTFSSMSLGLMSSWKRTPKDDDKSKAAFNVGIGYSSREIKVLGDGVLANEPLPTGEQDVRTKTKDVGAWVLMFSFTVF